MPNTNRAVTSFVLDKVIFKEQRKTPSTLRGSGDNHTQLPNIRRVNPESGEERKTNHSSRSTVISALRTPMGAADVTLESILSSNNEKRSIK